MRIVSIAVLAALAVPVPAFAAPTDEQVAAARLAFIDGDYESALAVIQAAAKEGNATALNILGAAYEEGRGVDIDSAKALSYFEQAAQAGDLRARYNLGSFFAFGSGDIAADRARAEREFRMAAEAGYAPALTALGQLSETENPPDHEAAADWYEKAHDAGDVVGTTNLAHAYVQGQGREEDWLRARVLYTEAAAYGFPRAFNDLGVIHEHGYGVHSDYLTAFTLYLSAVERGYAKAGTNLASLSVKARFPFIGKDAALGYCYWAIGVAGDDERAAFTDKCARVEDALEADEGLKKSARAIAARIGEN